MNNKLRPENPRIFLLYVNKIGNLQGESSFL